MTKRHERERKGKRHGAPRDSPCCRVHALSGCEALASHKVGRAQRPSVVSWKWHIQNQAWVGLQGPCEVPEQVARLPCRLPLSCSGSHIWASWRGILMTLELSLFGAWKEMEQHERRCEVGVDTGRLCGSAWGGGFAVGGGPGRALARRAHQGWGWSRQRQASSICRRPSWGRALCSGLCLSYFTRLCGLSSVVINYICSPCLAICLPWWRMSSRSPGSLLVLFMDIPPWPRIELGI